MTARRLTGPVRLTLGPELRDAIGGAWWPYTSSMARELPGLIDALREPLGEVIDIGVNWSSLERVPDLDQLSRSGAVPLPGQETRHHRVMTVTGSTAQVHLLIVPSDTTKGLAVMILRTAAQLPILAIHQHTDAFRTAATIVQAARAQHDKVAASTRTERDAVAASAFD
jgi:Family of unknown function (DUF5994)